jgi:hypothetical protein
MTSIPAKDGQAITAEGGILSLTIRLLRIKAKERTIRDERWN